MFTALVECIFTGLVAGATVVVAARFHLVPLLVMYEEESDETPE